MGAHVRKRKHAQIGKMAAAGLMCAAAAGAASMTGMVAAHAAELSSGITSVDVKQTSVQYGQTVEVDLGWAIPDTANAGDTMWVQLPSQIARSNTKFTVLSKTGEVIGNGTVDASGRATITLTSYVDTHSNITGTAKFYATFDAQLPADTTVDLTFATNGPTYSDQVKVVLPPPIDRTSSAKAGQWADPDDQGTSNPADAIKWVVDSPQGPSTSTIYNDQAASGETFDCATITVRTTTDYDPKTGYLMNLTTVPSSDYTVDCTSSEWTLTMNRPLGSGEIVRVGFDANVTDPTRSGYNNVASVNVDGNRVDASAELDRFDAGGAGDGDGQGPLKITKVIDGTGAANATGPYVVSVDCKWNGSEAPGYPQDVTFDAAGSQDLTAPIASVCTAEETKTGGATTSVVSPAAGVTVTKDAAGTVELTVTNTFDAPTPTPTPTPTVTPTPTPTPAPTSTPTTVVLPPHHPTPAHHGGVLPNTGAPAMLAGEGLLGLLLIGGGAYMIRSRRRFE